MKLVSGNALKDKLASLWDKGLPPGFSTGWKSVDNYYTVAPGQLTIVTGWPGSGKSEWVDALMVNLSKKGWQFAVFSPENRPIEFHAAKLLEKITGQPFGAGPTDRIRREELGELVDSITMTFGLLDIPTDGGATVPAILDAATTWFNSYAGERTGLVLDPWNELEHWRPSHLSETEYISQTLSTIRNWARSTQTHVWLVAHPAKARREDGKLPVPRPDMISGSQHWWNKADACITVWRDMENMEKQEIEIHVQKMRFKHLGRPGLIPLRYDRVTGRYYEADPVWVGASMRVA